VKLLAPEQIAKMQSREWRLGSLYRIVDEQGISVQFRPNDVQRALWDELWFWNLILKGRQHGISTFICLLMLDSCLFTPNTHCGLIVATLADATKKLDKVRFAYEHLPSEIKAFVPIRADNATCLEWKNGSRIDVGTSHRGGTLQILHVSEMGKIAAEAPARSREIRTGASAPSTPARPFSSSPPPPARPATSSTWCRRPTPCAVSAGRYRPTSSS